MRLPNFRRLFSSDYKNEMKNFADQFGVIYNANNEAVYNALNNNLTFGDNFAATVAEFSVNVDTNGKPNQVTTLRMSNNQNTVGGIIVINAIGGNNSDILPTAGVYVDAIKDGSLLTIRNVRGLTPGISYRIKAVILA